MTMINSFDPAFGDGLSAEERALIARRQRLLGPAYRLFYQRPVHIVRGAGVWLFDSAGRRYLDAYNNVASVGHCHPRVVAAIATQAATLNTHTRYLSEPILEYAQALLGTLPSAMENVMFTCTGSEANDLALRIARAVTGASGVIVTSNAYHGVTDLLASMSPSLVPGAKLAAFVRAVEPPLPEEQDAGRKFALRVRAAADDLSASGFGPPTLLLDTILSSDGVLGASPGVISEAVDAVREAGGLFIADEVQAGLGRVGTPFWGFAFHGVEPDFVTCGKPLGDGHPIAIVVTRAAFAQTFGASTRYFNTFGGNPVAAAAGLAVLTIIAEDDLPAKSERVGGALRQRLTSLAARDERLVHVRGAGLSIGVALTSPMLAQRIVNDLRERCILISATGMRGDVLKIRPPLCFAEEHADLLVSMLGEILSNIPHS